MNLQNKYLEDESGSKFAPITTPNAIRWPDGTNLNDNLPVVPAISTNINDDASSDTKTTSPKAVKDFVEGKHYTTNTGTITGITMNGSSKGTSGVVDLGTVITDVSGKEDSSNKVTSLSASSTNTQYPSAKVVYDEIKNAAIIDPQTSVLEPLNFETSTNKVQTLTGNESNTVKYPSCKAVADAISVKEDITTIEAPVNQSDATAPITTLTTQAGKYYRIDVAVNTLAVTLPAMNDATHGKSVVLFLTGGTTPNVTISSTAVNGSSPAVYFSEGFAIETGDTYEVNCYWNGLAWIVASVKIVISNS